MHFKLAFNSNLLRKCAIMTLISPQTWQNVWVMLFFFFFLYLSIQRCDVPHLAVRPAQLNFIHAPQFVDVLS